MKKILLLLILILCCSCVAPASAWLSGFQYERDLEITSTYPITLTSYQIKVTFWNTTGVSSGSNCYLNGSITQPTTWNDLRVTTTTDAICDIWIQESNETAAIVWIEVPYIYTGTTRLRVYTDKAVATAVSDGDATFRFYGTFAVNPLNVDKWVGVGNYTLYDDASNNSVASIWENATSGDSYITSLDTFAYATGYEQVIHAKMTQYPATFIGLYSGASSYLYFGMSQAVNNTLITETRTGPGGQAQQTTIGTGYGGAFHIWKIKRSQTGTSCVFTIDNVVVANHTTYIPTVAIPMTFRSTAPNGNVVVDWAFTKKYVDPEPTITFWGAPTVEGNPNTQFEANPRFGPVGTTVYFYDLTTGAHDGWLWDVNGDGTTDFTTQNCNYTYNTAGTYNVSLSTSNVNGTDVQFEQNYILITGAVTPTIPTAKIPSLLLAILVLVDFGLIIYVLADNERIFGSIIAALISIILSFYLGMVFVFGGGTDAGTSFTDAPAGWFFIFVGVVMVLVMLMLIVYSRQEPEEDDYE